MVQMYPVAERLYFMPVGLRRMLVAGADRE